MTRTLLAMLLLLSACAKPKRPITTLDYESVPHIASPRSTTYSQSPGMPSDPVIASIVAATGIKWDEALAGAVAGLAVEVLRKRTTITPWAAREALWDAGWAYGVERINIWDVVQGAPPPPALAEALATIPAGASVGLARVRVPDADGWVLVVSQPKVNLGDLPRQVQLEGKLTLPAIVGGTVHWVSPDGIHEQARLDMGASLAMPVAGEWLVEIQQGTTPIARFPVYSGLVPPQLSPIQGPPPTVREPEAAESKFIELLNRARELYSAKPMQRDPFLDSGARGMTSNRDLDGKEVLISLGIDPKVGSTMDCIAPSVAHCLDRALWDVTTRGPMLAPDAQLGLAIQPDTAGVRVVALFAPSPSDD